MSKDHKSNHNYTYNIQFMSKSGEGSVIKTLPKKDVELLSKTRLNYFNDGKI